MALYGQDGMSMGVRPRNPAAGFRRQLDPSAGIGAGRTGGNMFDPAQGLQAFRGWQAQQPKGQMGGTPRMPTGGPQAPPYDVGEQLGGQPMPMPAPQAQGPQETPQQRAARQAAQKAARAAKGQGGTATGMTVPIAPGVAPAGKPVGMPPGQDLSGGQAGGNMGAPPLSRGLVQPRRQPVNANPGGAFMTNPMGGGYDF